MQLKIWRLKRLIQKTTVDLSWENIVIFMAISSKDIEKKSPILYLKYTIVFIISFVSLIIILDTFKKPLSITLPNLEIILQNFYETLKDVFLFLKDLIN